VGLSRAAHRLRRDFVSEDSLDGLASIASRPAHSAGARDMRATYTAGRSSGYWRHVMVEANVRSASVRSDRAGPVALG
jgi:hypothetical protein